MITNGQIRDDIDHRTYHAWPDNAALLPGDARRCLSRSELMQMLDCGEMFLAGGRKPRSASLSLGSLVDCMLLTPDDFASGYQVQPSHYQSIETKGRGKDKVTTTTEKPWTNLSKTCRQMAEKWREEGRVVIKQQDHDEAAAMVDALRAKRVQGTTVGELVDMCATQVVITAQWQCPETGLTVPIRALPDMVRYAESGPVIYDLKTSQEVSRWEFERSIRKYNYDVQAWMYSAMMESATGCEVPFGFIAVRNTKPHLVATYRSSMSTLRQGEEKFRRAMTAYCQCLKTGRWDGYTTSFELI